MLTVVHGSLRRRWDPSGPLFVSPIIVFLSSRSAITMRYVVALVLLGSLLAGAAPTHAQSERRMGLTLGANWATLQSPGADPAGQLEFGGGLVLRQPLVGPVSLQPELLLNQKGGEIRGEDGSRVEYSAGYLELPVLVHMEAPALGPVTVHAEAGGYGALKIYEQQAPGEDAAVSFDSGISFFQRTNAGLLAGVGATLSVRERTLNLTLRRDWGLPDVARNVDSSFFPETEFPDEGRTRTWSLLLRLGF